MTIRVRYGATCGVATIVPTETPAHVEGHLVMVSSHPAAAPSALAPVVDLGSQRAQTLLRLGIGILVAVALIVLLALRLRRAGRR